MAKDPKHNQIVMAAEVVHFDPEAFDMMLRSNGVEMIHYRAIQCPLGVEDRHDAARNHVDHDCSNGFIYKEAGTVTVFFSSNSSSSKLEDLGLFDGTTTMVTLPSHYDGENAAEIAVQHYDRFFLKELKGTSVNTQLIEAHITGIDRLQYRAVKVEAIMDSNGVEYFEGDYVIEDGAIRWTGSKRPSFNPTTNRGTVYSIRYRYVPFWYVSNIIHEVRVAKRYDHALEREEVVRLPYQVQLQREFMFENEDRKLNGKSDFRDIKSPRSGSFGPR